MRNTILIALSSALFMACGIPGDTLLTELDEKQWELICDRAVDPDAGDRVVDCDGVEITIEAASVSDCVNGNKSAYTASSCAGTLDDWAACADEDLTDGQICGTEAYEPSDECVAVGECIDVAA